MAKKRLKKSAKDKFIYLLILGVIAIIKILTEDNVNITDDIVDGVQVHFIDVGQGDCQLIVDNDKVMLIDGGENSQGYKVAKYIKSLNIDKIDYVVATHPHSDHIGGLDVVINEIDVNNIIMPKVTSTTKTFEDLVLAIQKNDVNVIEPMVGDVINFDNTTYTILGPNSDNYGDNLNNYSVIVRMDHEDVSFLFTGDAEKFAENEILNNGYNIDVDIFKAGHHGSSTSNSIDFLSAVSPSVVVFTVGEDNSYNHPHKEVLEELSKFTSKIYRTDKDGTVIIVSDGTSVSIIKEKE